MEATTPIIPRVIRTSANVNPFLFTSIAPFVTKITYDINIIH